MTTPKRKAIIEKAIELFHNARARDGDPSFDITPTARELKEDGFYSEAVTKLMRDRHSHEIESDFIDFPRNFTVDLQTLFDSNALILGSRKSGKSDIGMMVCERAMRENAVIVCFDPSMDWLRRSNVPRYITVETDLIVPDESTIYDLSLMSPYRQQRIVELFCKRLFDAQARMSTPRQFLVVFEEAHTYFYQGCMRAKNMQNSVRLLSVGRNVDIAVVLISQFASMLDKFAIKHSTAQAWFGFTREPNDLHYLRQILGKHTEELTKLRSGEFIYMTINGFSKIAIEPYEGSVVKNRPIRIIDMVYNEDELKYTVNIESPKQGW